MDGWERENLYSSPREIVSSSTHKLEINVMQLIKNPVQRRNRLGGVLCVVKLNHEFIFKCIYMWSQVISVTETEKEMSDWRWIQNKPTSGTWFVTVRHNVNFQGETNSNISVKSCLPMCYDSGLTDPGAQEESHVRWKQCYSSIPQVNGDVLKHGANM